MNINESIVECAALTWFGELGNAVEHGPQIAPGQPKQKTHFANGDPMKTALYVAWRHQAELHQGWGSVGRLEHDDGDYRFYYTRGAEYYNLDAIIAVGYRVNSFQATQFRIWATKTLREFMTKGFVLDDERLKQGKRVFGNDYFDELLEAKLKAEGEYEVFRQRQDADFISDFDREIKRLEGNKE